MAWRTGLGAALALLVVTTSGTAHAAPAPEPARSAAELQADADRRAGELQADADRRAGELAREHAAQAAADAQAAAALEAYQVAQRRAEQAARVSAAEEFALRTARLRTAAARAALARYLGSVYRSGVGNSSLSVLSDLIDAKDPQALFTGLGMANRVGGKRNDQLDVLHASEAAQREATARAAAAAKAAAEATATAEKARAAAAAVVAAQKERVARAAAALTASQQTADVAAAREAALARAEVIARTRAAVPLAALVGAAVPRPTAGCTGGSTAGYPNGRIPAEVLCPLWGTSGQMLRADAAAAFNAMSKKYAETFETPIAVTDSYRSFDEQVAVRAAKPTLAAVPGSSNHGWGVALDLGDGIQSFSTPQHRWMVENAMAFGWFLPAWAQADGSKPEAWHWEYAG